MSILWVRYRSSSARVLERVRRVAGPVEVLLLEGARVQDEEPALLQVRQMDLEGGGVHRHEAVEAVPRGVDPPAPELELEAGHAEEGAGGGADLGREVGQRRDVVAGPRRLAGELLAGQLHAVARIPRESHDGAIQDAPRLDRGRHGGRGLAHGPSVSLRRMKLSNGPARWSAGAQATGRHPLAEHTAHMVPKGSLASQGYGPDPSGSPGERSGRRIAGIPAGAGGPSGRVAPPRADAWRLAVSRLPEERR